jgi:hypothetical protein
MRLAKIKQCEMTNLASKLRHPNGLAEGVVPELEVLDKFLRFCTIPMDANLVNLGIVN